MALLTNFCSVARRVGWSRGFDGTRGVLALLHRREQLPSFNKAQISTNIWRAQRLLGAKSGKSLVHRVSSHQLKPTRFLRWHILLESPDGANVAPSDAHRSFNDR
ncbi:MAG: hypothetical protein C4334_01845 [Pyrinomonas sp.]